MRIVALDMAIRTGWAYVVDGRLVASGVQSFAIDRSESVGMRYLRFQRWLDDNWKNNNVDLVVYEIAHHRGGAATECGVGLMTHLKSWCARVGCTYAGCHTATLKLLTAGKGNASKEEMVAAALENWGIQPADDNEADALALAQWALDGCPLPKKRPKKRPKRTK